MEFEELYEDVAVGSKKELLDAVRSVAMMPTWDTRRAVSAEQDPWSHIQQATLDFGNVRASAYPVSLELVRAAKDRSVLEQSSVVYFVQAVVFDVLIGAIDIPDKVRAPFCQMLVDLSSLADACLNDSSIKIGNRGVAVGALFLARHQIIQARVLFEWATTCQVSFLCGSCGQSIGLSVEHAQGFLVSEGSAKATRSTNRDLQSRWGDLCRSSLEYGLDRELVALSTLALDVECGRCGRYADTWQMAIADVLARCPLARVPGWEPG